MTLFYVIFGDGPAYTCRSTCNKNFHNAINQVPQKVPPIWFMRQAGRYHSHYQGLRKTYSFVELCKNPELAAEVALGPINDFDYDVAILFSDILFPLESLGLKLDYKPGPIFDGYLTHRDIKTLKPAQDLLPDLNFQAEALTLTRNSLSNDKSLVGFVGGPWTLLSYGVGIKNEPKINNVENNIFYEKLNAALGLQVGRTSISRSTSNQKTTNKELKQNTATTTITKVT